MDAVTVPTGETSSISFYLDLLVELRRPALLVGLAGAGKTALINGKLRVLPDDYSSLSINFNYYTGLEKCGILNSFNFNRLRFLPI
jgi:dynein heavy chain